jgi:hypothetical protein
MMDERATRRFDHAHALERIHAGLRAIMRFENLRLVEQPFHAFERMNDLDQARGGPQWSAVGPTRYTPRGKPSGT